MKLVMKVLDVDGVEYIVHNPDDDDIAMKARRILNRGYAEIRAPKNRVAILFSKFIVSLFMDEVEERRQCTL